MLDWRPLLYTKFSSHGDDPLHTPLIVSVRTGELTPDVLSSLEQTAWPKGGVAGSPSDFMDPPPCFSLLAAVCPFLTLAPVFLC